MAAIKTTKLRQKLLARAKTESKALAPYVRRALAKHARAGKQVYVVDSTGRSAWVNVSSRGIVKEPSPPPYGGSRAPAKRK
jgi:hypothetical protein